MSRPGESGSGLDATLDVVGRRKWLGLAVFGVLGAMAVAVATSVPDVYRSTATVLVERDRMSEAFVRSSVTAEIETRLSTISQELLSRSRLEALIVQFGLYADMRAHAPIEAAVEQMRRDIRLDPKSVEQTSGRPATIAFSISYRGRDPRVIADVTNTLASLSVDENAKMRERQATGTALLLEREVDEMKKRLAQEERQLHDFRAQHSGQLPEQLSINLATIERLNGQLQLARNSLTMALERRTSVAKQLADAEGVAAPSGGGPDAGVARLLKLRQELRELRSHFSERYPDVIRVRTEIAELERELAATPAAGAATAESAAARTESDQLVKQMSTYQQRAERAAPIEQEFQMLSRDYGATKERYFALIKRYEDAVLAETMEQRQPREQFRVLDPALVADSPIAPNRPRLMAIGLVLAFLTAGAAVIVAEQIGTPFHSLDSLRALTRVPILASIPIIVTAADRRRAARRFWLTAASVTALALIAVKLSSLVAGTQLIVGILTKGAS